MSTNKKANKKAIANAQKKKTPSKMAVKKSDPLPVPALLIDPETTEDLSDDDEIDEEWVETYHEVVSIETTVSVSVKWSRG
jgi:ribosomal protein S25